MLKLMIDKTELFDEGTQQFIEIKPITIKLEHSLVSIAKWESKWKIPFLIPGEKTREQDLDYIKCMTITQNVPDSVYLALTPEHMQIISDYISDTKSATTFHKTTEAPNRQVLTSEVIYYMMFQYNIPYECHKWHLSRLLTLIRVASIKNSSPKKMSKNAILSQNKALNAARRKKFNTKG